MNPTPTPREIAEMTKWQAEQKAALSDEDLALNMLALMFDRYEDGTTCYEDPEEHSGHLGNAIQLSNDEFHTIADLLNRRRPVLNMAANPPSPRAGDSIEGEKE